ncbi:MAG: hypothetical protein LAN37_05180 [Acidobacteriia bacterium]|nr:hypothetical protein [Terriglobia bacterium]
MLVISVVLGLLPLAGIGWIGASGWLETVDGLFMSLILTAMAGVFLLNAGLQAKAMGLIPGSDKKAANGA